MEVKIQLKNFPLPCLIDLDDFNLVSKFTWKINNMGYAVPCTYVRRGILMHRFILNLSKADKVNVDHINGNKLDNRRCNLRICDQRINRLNSTNIKHTSKYRGVSWDKLHNKWRASISLGKRKVKYIGLFEIEIEAAKAWNKIALEVYGNLAKLNIIESEGVPCS